MRSAWQKSDITCTRIIFKNEKYETDNFKMTKWRQASDIVVWGKKAGTVEVYCMEEKLKQDEVLSTPVIIGLRYL